MGLKPGIEFELADKVEKDYQIPELNMSLETMEVLALENRPELAESRYQERISEKELTAAKLKMLPGINLSTSLSYENSDYLLNNDWYSYGANVSWNLLNVFKASTNNKVAKTQIEVAKEQKLALSMAVLSQVHLSIVKFNQAKKEYLLSKDYLTVADDIYTLTQVENDLNVNGRLILIKEKLNNILATLRYSSSYANVQNSYGRIFASLGIDDKNSSKVLVKEEVQKVEQNQNFAPVLEVNEAEEQNVVQDTITETSILPVVKAEQTPKKTQTKIDDNFYNRNFYDSKITIYTGETLVINGNKYVVKKSDDISKIAKDNKVSVKAIVIENYWLVENNRVKFK